MSASITQLYNTIANDLRNKLNLSDSELKTVVDALASSLAGQFKLADLYLDDNRNEQFPDKAKTVANGGTLERHGQIQLNRGINAATSAVMNVSVTGDAGSVLRSELTFKNENGLLYVLDTEYTLTGSNDIIEIRSLGGGSDYNLNIGDELTITEPVIGVNQSVFVDEIVTSGLAAETVEAYRTAILNSLQLEPQGGSRTDYRLWAQDAQGVRLVYPYVKDGDSGTMQVYVEATATDSTDGNGTPSNDILNDVEEVIYFDPDETKADYERGRIPLQANLEVLPISLNPVDVTITGLNINTAEIQASIQSNLETYLLSVRPFVAGGDLARNKNDILYSARLQSVVTDVLDSSNFFTDFVISVNGVNQTSYLFSRENIPYLRTLTFD